MGLEINNLYRFGEFELDAANRLFTHAGHRIPLPTRAFDLLAYMVRNPQRLLPKDELLKSVWGGAFVEDGNLTQSVFLLRKALSANQPAEGHLIVTVPGQGYLLAADVIEVPRPRPDAASDSVPFLPVAPPAVQSRRSRRWLPVVGIAAVLTGLSLILVPRFLLTKDEPPQAVPPPHPVTLNSDEDPVTAHALSPDGRYLAYAGARTLAITTLKSGEMRSFPVAEGVSVARLVWYPDGTRLLVSERVNGLPVIMVLSVLSGTLNPLREGAVSPAISPDGNRVLYSDGEYRQLWLMTGTGEKPRQVMEFPQSDHVYPMFWSPGGNRIWFARVHSDKDDNTITLESCDETGGSKTVALSEPRAVAFVLLPGRVVYARSEPGGHSFTNLWEVPVNAAEGKANAPARQLTNWPDISVSQLSATADGKHLAFTNGSWQADVYLGDLHKGGAELANTRRLTLDQSDDWPAFWTADDNAVVFESNRNGRSQIFRQRVDQTLPELLSADLGDADFPVFGGPWIYFYSLPSGTKLVWDKPVEIRRIAADGGASVPVLNEVGPGIACAERNPSVCVLARLRGKVLSFYHFDHANGPGSEFGHMDFDTSLWPEFSLSPDGSKVVAIDPGGDGNRLRVIPVDGSPASDVQLSGRKGLENPFWAADGKGWFVSSLAPGGVYLLHVSPNGESQVIFEQPQNGRVTWGIPSHDGKHLAYLRWTAARNIWMIDGF